MLPIPVLCTLTLAPSKGEGIILNLPGHVSFVPVGSRFSRVSR
jgi:hypothetical protein